MGDGNANNGNGLSLLNPKLLIFIAGMGTASIIVAIYHCITAGCCDPRRRPLHVRGLPRASTSSSGGMKHSDIESIPVHKYQKGEKMLTDDGTCAICLSEFEEGEELRSLPECAHSFHVPCIDMWLYSHLSCPMCRADANTALDIIRPRGMDADREETFVLEHVIVQPHVIQ